MTITCNDKLAEFFYINLFYAKAELTAATSESVMPKLSAHAPKKPFMRAAAFDYHAGKLALKMQMRLLAPTAATTPADPFESTAHPETPPLPFFRWRDVNWGLIGALLFSLLLWCVFLTSGLPALGSALHFVFKRSAA